MARRLPIYLLLDTSGSMNGEPIAAVQNGVQTLHSAFQNDLRAKDTAYLSVITFDSRAQQVSALTGLSQFYLPLPQLHAGGCTALGEALSLVAQCADREVIKKTPNAEGDWKPMVFVMSDGLPTEDLRSGLAEFNKSQWGMVVACASACDPGELKQITKHIVKLATADEASIKEYFIWVSQSITTNSKSVEETNQEISRIGQLPPPPPEITIF